MNERQLLGISALTTVAVVAAPFMAQAASLSVGAPAKVSVGDEFRVTVRATQAANIDTVRLIGSFSADLVEWVGASAGDLPNMSPGNSVNQAAGTFSLGVFQLGGSSKATNNIATLRFRAKKEGTARISLNGGTMVLSAGENVLQGMGAASVTIGPKQAVTTQEPPSQPSSISIVSSSHPDQNAWYQNPVIALDLQSKNVTGLRYSLDQDPQGTAKDVAPSPFPALTVPSDGVWYLHVLGQSNGQPIKATYRIQVDREAPSAFEPSLETDPAAPDQRWLLRFSSLDKTSGIARYEVYADDRFLTSVSGTQTLVSALRKDVEGKQIRIVAIDAANNFMAGTIQAPAPEVVLQIPTAPAESGTRKWSWTWLWILIALIVGLVLGRLSKPDKKPAKKRRIE